MSSPRAGEPRFAAEVERILAMSDEEFLATATPEELAWARGVKEGIKIGRLLASAETYPTAPTPKGG